MYLENDMALVVYFNDT